MGLKPRSAAEFTAGALVGITCVDFSIATYSLSLDDYEDIMFCAEGLSIYTYKKIKAFEKGSEDLTKAMIDPLEFVKGKGKEKAMKLAKQKTGINVKNLYDIYKGKYGQPKFSTGFKAVVELYFDTKID